MPDPMPKEKWKADGEDAALLFILFSEQTFHPDDFSPAGMYRHELLHPIFGRYDNRRFSRYAMTQANRSKNYKEYGTGLTKNFKMRIQKVKKDKAELLDKLGPWGGKDVSDDDEEGYEMSDQDDIEEEVVEDDASVASLSELLRDQDSDPVRIPTPKAATKQTPSNEKARKQKQPSTTPTNTATASEGIPNGKRSSEPKPTTEMPSTNEKARRQPHPSTLPAASEVLEFTNSILGRKLVDASYPDGRVFCWLAHDSGYANATTKIGFGKTSGREIYLLKKLPNATLDPKAMIHEFMFKKNDIHCVLAVQKIKEMIAQHEEQMEILAANVDVPSGWTAELVFKLPFDVEKYFLDANGNKHSHRCDMDQAQMFWLKKKGMEEDEDSDIEAVWDD
jgi:hypothetical protein